MRELFQIHTINMSVAVWVEFLALFGIATDDGVIMGTYLTQLFRFQWLYLHLEEWPLKLSLCLLYLSSIV